ncbi:MAG: guanylate kinase [Clostridia bacterium]|nr:guanylate kinase [Clostridia bacterium]
MSKGVLFLLSGPSGVGKGTVKAHLFEEFEKCLVYSVSATTRSPRQGETDGVDYYFIDRETFLKWIDEDAFLEHAEFSGNMYGTPRSAVMRQLEAGHDVFLEIEVQGALQVMEKMPECVSIFILPPSFEVLEQRLRGRGTESDEVVNRRLDQARRELPMADRYMYQLVNDTVDDTYAKLRELYLKHSSVVHEMYNV